MNNQIDFLNEQAKLDDTLKIINSEMLKYLEKRKVVTKYILDARKKYIEEYKDAPARRQDRFGLVCLATVLKPALTYSLKRAKKIAGAHLIPPITRCKVA